MVAPESTSLVWGRSLSMGDAEKLKLVRHQAGRGPVMPYMPIISPAALEVVAAPAKPLCLRCSTTLSENEVCWGTGLCNQCYGAVGKDCRLCHTRIPLKQLHWGSGLCSTCFHACDKHCRMCGSDIALKALHDQIGLCSKCYHTCQKKCKMCDATLELGELWWGTGLCNTCYSSWHKICKKCKEMPQGLQKHWSTGLCDACYTSCAKHCLCCPADVPLGSAHWRSSLCNVCGDGAPARSSSVNAVDDVYDGGRSPVPTGRVARSWSMPQPDGIMPLARRSGATRRAHADEKDVCALCRASCSRVSMQADVCEISPHWETGLCEECFHETERRCKKCLIRLPFGQRHWDIGLCEACHESCVQHCKTCARELSQNEQHWGFQLCDGCFAKCNRTCKDCNTRLDLRQLHWGTDVCDACYDKRGESQKAMVWQGVWAVVGAQFVFYFAPEMLKPSLFLHIQQVGYGPDAPRVLAWVQTMASVAQMLVPVPIGRLADRRGKRPIYCGVCLAAMAAAITLAVSPPASLFALAWALLNIPPPAIRGVRQAFFARNVPMKDLSSVGLWASLVGVFGGFLGPMTSTVLAQVVTEGPDGGAVDCFVAGAFVAIAIFGACTASLWLLMPPDATVGAPSAHGHAPETTDVEICEECQVDLSLADRQRHMALCNGCYDHFGGPNHSWRRYSRRVLACFCVIGFLLEFSLNAGVILAFQPVVVEHFGWGSSSIAAVYSTSALLSMAISLVAVKVRVEERTQTVFSAGLYLLAVVSFLAPPLNEVRLVVGVMMGISAQIMLYAPLEAIFAQLIGRTRVTTELATFLSMAPAVGTVLGASAAPACVAAAGSPRALLAAVPAALAFLGIATELALGWCLLVGERPALSRRLLQPGPGSPRRPSRIPSA